MKTAALLEVNPKNCVVFEDTHNGSKAAKAAGMYCIGFANPDYPVQELIADEIIQDFREINVAELRQKA